MKRILSFIFCFTLCFNVIAKEAGQLNVKELSVNDEFTFPTADGSASQILKTDGSGALTWEDDSGNVDQNLWETMTGDSGSIAANTTTDSFAITGGGIVTTAISGDGIIITGTEEDGSTTNEINTITTPDSEVTAGLAITFADTGIMTITENADTITFDATEVDGSITNELPIAGNDIDISGSPASTVDLEPELNYVTTITRASSDLTLSTTTTGDVLIDPVDNLIISSDITYDVTNDELKTENVASTDVGSGTSIDLTTNQVQHFLCEDDLATTIMIDDTATTNGIASTNTSNLSVVGKILDGFDLDGSECLNTDVAPLSSADQSYSFWMKSENANSANTIFFGSYNSVGRFYIGFNASQYLAIALKSSSYTTTTSTKKSTTDWEHYYIEYIDSTSTVNIYLNNSLEVSKTEASGALSTNDVHLGCLWSGAAASNHHNGIYDDYRRFDRVLTADERAFIYNSGTGTQGNTQAAGYLDLQNGLSVLKDGTVGHSSFIDQSNDDGSLKVYGNTGLEEDLYVGGNVGIGITSASDVNNELTVTGSVDVSGNVGIGTTAPDQNLEVIGTASFGDDATNNVTFASDGFATYIGNAKFYCERPFTFNYSKITGQGAPTLVSRGVFSGFSLPIYNSDDEELTTCDCVIGGWDGTSDPVIYIGGWLDTANTDKKFNLQVSVETVDYASNAVVPATTNDYPVETTTGTWAQYTGFKIAFTLDASAIGLAVGQPIAIRVRRLAASTAEITGEVVIEGAAIAYVCNKNGGDTE